MPFVPVANTSMVHIRYTQDGQDCENTFAYRWAQPPNQQTLLALAQEVWGTIGVKMQRQMSPDVTFRQVYVRNIDTPVAEQATYVLPPNTVGSRSGGAAPNNVACQLTKRSGYTGRTSRGANRFGGFVKTDIDKDTFVQAIVGFVIDLAVSVAAARLGGLFQAAVASRVTNSSALVRSVALLDSLADSQKTRLPGHGD